MVNSYLEKRFSSNIHNPKRMTLLSNVLIDLKGGINKRK